MPPAARITDMHKCPMVDPGPKPHKGGPIIKGASTVIIEGLKAARKGDNCLCVGVPRTDDKIAMGSPTVLIEGKDAARKGDPCTHGGQVKKGASTVEIGVKGKGECLASAAASGAAFVSTSVSTSVSGQVVGGGK
jgi:uncharacterized Zn-binding protein involved in type VI secretion